MGDLCLSKSEVKDLTRTPIKARQVDFMRRNGIRHYLDADGWPVVLRSTVEGRKDDGSAKGWNPNKAA